MKDATEDPAQVLELFHPVTAAWFRAVFDHPTAPQWQGWPAIARGENTLIFAPTGTGKTLTAFLWCLDRLMLHPPKDEHEACRVIYISPLKALAVDVERNLRSPLAGIANMARQQGVAVHQPGISVRTGDTPQKERAQFKRHPSEILITTPESLYLLLTSEASASLRSSTRSSLTKFTRSSPPNAERISPSRLNGWRRSPRSHCNVSAYLPHSVRSRKWHIFSPEPRQYRQRRSRRVKACSRRWLRARACSPR
jgi:hypothetical protein